MGKWDQNHFDLININSVYLLEHLIAAFVSFFDSNNLSSPYSNQELFFQKAGSDDMTHVHSVSDTVSDSSTYVLLQMPGPLIW